MMKRFFAVALFCLAPTFGNAECRDNRVAVRGEGAAAFFNVEIADDPQEQARGLMFVEALPIGSGMLFVFDQEADRAFWMRNTLIPLDIIFLDASGVVLNVHHNAIPLDETPLPSSAPAQYVLEINGGLAQSLGIIEGSELRHPSLDPEIAAWPCE